MKASTWADMVDRVRLGLIGYGGWGRRVAKTIANIPDCMLAGVATRAGDTADTLPSGIPIYKNWRALITDEKLDGVVIATSPKVRVEIARACLESGIPAYLEKPIALNGLDSARLAESSTRAGVLLMAGHLHLYAPAFRSLKTAVENSDGLLRIDSKGGNTGPFRTDYSALLDYGPHDVSMILALTDSTPRTVEARRLQRREDGVSEVIEAELRFPRCTATMTVGNLFETKQRRLEAETVAGSFVYDECADEIAVRQNRDGTCTPLEIATGMPLTASIARFADLIRDGRTQDPDFDQAVTVMHVLDAIASAADTGAAIAIEHNAVLAH